MAMITLKRGYMPIYGSGGLALKVVIRTLEKSNYIFRDCGLLGGALKFVFIINY